MQRPNLASKPFESTRPVWLASVVLALAAVTFSVVTITEAVGARDTEKAQVERLQSLSKTRSELAGQLEKTNRELARIAWKKLQTETASLQGVVARRQLSWSLLLLDLERVLPWDVRLLAIDPRVLEEGGVEVGLRGVAASREAWLRLVARLFADESFFEPVPISEESPDSGAAQGYLFQLRVKYAPGGRG